MIRFLILMALGSLSSACAYTLHREMGAEAGCDQVRKVTMYVAPPFGVGMTETRKECNWPKEDGYDVPAVPADPAD